VDALVNALFVSTRMVDNCANVQQYANKVCACICVPCLFF